MKLPCRVPQTHRVPNPIDTGLRTCYNFNESRFTLRSDNPGASSGSKAMLLRDPGRTTTTDG